MAQPRRAVRPASLEPLLILSLQFGVVVNLCNTVSSAQQPLACVQPDRVMVARWRSRSVGFLLRLTPYLSPFCRS